MSPSTAPGTVDEPMTTPPPEDSTLRDHLGFPLTPSPRRNRQIPEDDGMRELRTLIQTINSRDIPGADKAKLMHEALLLGYRASKVASHTREAYDGAFLPHGESPEPAVPNGPLETLKYWQNQIGEHLAAPEKFELSESDIAPTYAPIRHSRNPGNEAPPQVVQTATNGTQLPLGCQHYERNVKLQCSTCKKWYTCRFCHDAQEDHTLIRKDTKNMLCMLCATPQRASDICINCGEMTAQYYCDICKLWENRQSKPIYHCADCGICRRGMGLGKDFFHCKVSSFPLIARRLLMASRHVARVSRHPLRVRISVLNAQRTAIARSAETTCSHPPSPLCSWLVVTVFTRNATTNI